MSASSRLSIPSPPPLVIRKRSRAATKTLLGHEYPETFDGIVECPKPGKDTHDYDADRIRKGLLYAEISIQSTTRCFSPLGLQAVRFYKETCARWLSLDAEDPEDHTDGERADIIDIQEELVAQIRSYEQSVQYVKALASTKTESADELQEALLRLQKFAFYARYGDILGDICTRMKADATKREVSGWKTLVNKYWTDIDATLEKEKEAYEKVLTGGNTHTECPTHMAISQACEGIGFQLKEMLECIHQYAVRNSLFHTDIIGMVKKGHYSLLITVLYKDLCDIPKTIGGSENMSGAILTSLLRTLIEQWFSFDKEDLDNPMAWGPSQNLIEYRKKLKTSGSDDIKFNKAIIKSIIAGMAKRQEAEKAKELIEGTEVNLYLDKFRPVRRVRSENLEAMKEAVKRRTTMWNRMEGWAIGIRSVSADYIQEFGAILPLEEIIEDDTPDNL